MRTGLTKKRKTTAIYFDEQSRIIEVQTHNANLKNQKAADSICGKAPAAVRPTMTSKVGRPLRLKRDG